MTSTMASGRRRPQRASRLSRDLLMELSTAWAALRKAQALARKLEKAPPGKTATRLAAEIAVHIQAARKALSRASRPRPARPTAADPVRRQRAG